MVDKNKDKHKPRRQVVISSDDDDDEEDDAAVQEIPSKDQ